MNIFNYIIKILLVVFIFSCSDEKNMRFVEPITINEIINELKTDSINNFLDYKKYNEENKYSKLIPIKNTKRELEFIILFNYTSDTTELWYYKNDTTKYYKEISILEAYNFID